MPGPEASGPLAGPQKTHRVLCETCSGDWDLVIALCQLALQVPYSVLGTGGLDAHFCERGSVQVTDEHGVGAPVQAGQFP